MASPVKKPLLIVGKPVVLKKKQLFLTSKRIIKLLPPYKEDVIYESSNGDFLGGESLGVTIINKLNRLTNINVTIAKYNSSNNEKTSERVASLIGQQNYDIVLSALCSVISEELKARAILALLTSNKPKDTSTQTLEELTLKEFCDATCQTEGTFGKAKPKKGLRAPTLRPYVADEVEKTVKKIVIHPNDYKDPPELNNLELNAVNLNNSIDNLSFSSTTTNSQIYNPSLILDNIAQSSRQVDDIGSHVNMTISKSPRASVLTFCHRNIAQSIKEKTDMMKTQALMDFNSCDKPDEEGNFRIHCAVKDNDIGLLIRQCLALKTKKKAIDLPVDGDWTPLKMAILKNQPNMTSLLLRFDANPLLSDNDQKTAIHHAAEMPHSHLAAIVERCVMNPRKVLKQNDELWDDNYETMPDHRLSRLLLGAMCSTCDNQGYTPLMLASKLGNYANVELLIRVAPSTINNQMPTCGDTALYLSIVGAGADCIDRGDNSVVALNFIRTIEALVANGADPGIENRSGSNVHILLDDFNITPLTTLVVNKLTSIKYFDDNMPEPAKHFDMLLVKDNEGTVDVIETTQQKNKPDEIMEKDTNNTTDKLEETSPTVKESNISVKMVPTIPDKTNLKISTTTNTTDKPPKRIPTKVNTKSDKPGIVQNILLSTRSGGSKKRKSSEINLGNTLTNFVQKNTVPDKNVMSRKAGTIKEIMAQQKMKSDEIKGNSSKNITNKIVKTSPTEKDGNISVKMVPIMPDQANLIKSSTTNTTDKLPKTVASEVNTNSDKPTIVENILLSPSSGGSKKRKSSPINFENTFKKFIQSNTVPDNNVKSGKAGIIKDIKIVPPKEYAKIHYLRQPAKKRIKTMYNAK